VRPVGNAALRWSILGLLLGMFAAGLVVSGLIVFRNGSGPGVGDRVSSVFDPPEDPAEDREAALAAAHTFVERFYTYGPDMLTDEGKLPDYAAVGELMSAKFRSVFEQNVTLAEETVKQTGIDRVATVYAVGITSIDEDSASLLVGGTVTSSYPNPEDSGKPISLAPQRFRYEVELVKISGEWKVDDLDDVDDGLPSLGDSTAGEAPTDAPTGAPNDAPQPSGSPASSPSGSPSSSETQGSEQ